MQTSESTVRANGIDIAFDTFGDRDCTPMVLIMGLSSQMIIWEDDFCSRLAAKGFWVIRFDNRDVGNSTRLDVMGMPRFRDILNGVQTGMPYTLDDMAEDTTGLLDALDIESAHIVGASMGGMIAQILATEKPERVRTLTIIMSSTGNPLLPPPKPEAVQYLFLPFPTQRDDYIDHFIRMWKILNGNELPMDDERLMELAERTFERGVSPVASARQFAAILASGSRKESLASIQAPTLVIHGERDPLLPLECGIDVARSIPGSRLKIIPGMGHAMPPVVWREVIDVIAEHAQTKRPTRDGKP